MASLARYPSLVDRVVLITGGSTGIGETLVEQFVAQGARVGFVDIDVPNAEALVKRLTPGAKTPPLFVQADITDIAKLEAAIDMIRGRLGPITVLLNNAANDQRHKIEDTTPESWDKGIAVNLKHQFFAAKNVSTDMKAAGGGSIVNFGSVSWKLTEPKLMIEPPPAAFMSALTFLAAKNWCFRFTATPASQLCGVVSSILWRWSLAALLSSTVIGPKRRRTVSIAASSCAMSVMSVGTNSGVVLAPAARRLASASPLATSMSTKPTRAPWATNCSTSVSPMPVEPPVISTTRSTRLG